MSELRVDKLTPQSGTALQIGDSSDVITIPAGATITNSGTANGFGGGKVLQLYVLENSAGHSSSTVFSGATTLPTITDGASLFDAVAFTPTSASSQILVEADVVTSGTSGGHATVWMCKDSDSTAIAVSACHSQTDYVQLLKLAYVENATNTNATWGGLKSWIKITEYAT